MLGISVDSVEDNAAFAKQYEFNFPLLCDTDRTVSMAYGACDSPTAPYAKRISYLIDEQGKIERVYDKVNARQHASDVLADLMSSDQVQ